MHDDVLEFPFVAELPKREKSRVVDLWALFREMKATTEQEGFLIPTIIAADLVGISRQRVHELVGLGRLKRVTFRNNHFITEHSLMEFAKSERKAGRPTSPGKKFKVAGFVWKQTLRDE